MSHKLHIVSFNVPFPADYGGIIDVYYRIKALHKLGVEIHLHTFTYGRSAAPELDALCSSVTYYRRRTGLPSALTKRPYIVESRDSKELIANLSKDNAPILLEGLHCCSVLEVIDGSRIMVRAHNVEHEYYSRLADATSSLFRRIYLRSDARKLERYEPLLTKAAAVFAVTEADAAHFHSIGCKNVLLMPSSHADDEVVSTPSQPLQSDGVYALYHADLSVPENIEAVTYLADNIFSKCSHRFVVAGRNPSKALSDKLSQLPNVTIKPNPDNETMQRLIAQAQVLIMVTQMPTGLKLKLLNSLYAGRHCLVNSAMVAGTELGKLCTVVDDADSLLQALQSLMDAPFTQQDIDRRRQLLGSLYSNEANARILISQLAD